MASALLTSHVTCGVNKKIIKCPWLSLLREIVTAFKLESDDFFLQIWNTDFDDWLDLLDLTELEGKEKIRLNVVIRYICFAIILFTQVQ